MVKNKIFRINTYICSIAAVVLLIVSEFHLDSQIVLLTLYLNSISSLLQ